MPVQSRPFSDAPVLKTLTLHLLLHKIAVHLIKRSGISTLSPPDILFLAEKLPSTINALLVSLPSLYLHFSLQPWKQDVLIPYPPLLDKILAAHVGYTLYDIYIMAIVGKQHPSVWIHHVLGALGAGLMRKYQVASFFPAVFLPSELTVVATNALWVLQKLGRDNTKGYGIWLWIRAVLFCLVRAPAGLVGLWYAIKVVSERPKELWERFKRLPTVVWVLTMINYTTFTGLNLYWTVLVFRALIRYREKAGIHHI